MEEKKLLIKWFKKIYHIKNIEYDEAIDELISYRESKDKEEQRVYEAFCYMSDIDWFDVLDEVKK